MLHTYCVRPTRQWASMCVCVCVCVCVSCPPPACTISTPHSGNVMLKGSVSKTVASSCVMFSLHLYTSLSMALLLLARQACQRASYTHTHTHINHKHTRRVKLMTSWLANYNNLQACVCACDVCVRVSKSPGRKTPPSCHHGCLHVINLGSYAPSLYILHILV